LLLIAVLRRLCCWRPQSIDISCPRTALSSKLAADAAVAFE